VDFAYSVNSVPIRLTHERWYHITENHDELASYFFDVLDAIENPDLVVRGNRGTLKVVRNFGKRKWLTVIYKEISKTNGFVITAYFLDTVPKGEIIWRQQ
jgi:hypothetical protein